MSDQQTFASVAWSQKGKVTRRERFLAEMNAVIPSCAKTPPTVMLPSDST